MSDSRRIPRSRRRGNTPPECDDSTFANRPHPAIGEYNVYYGGFHNHYHITDLSDAFGEPEQAYRYARCVAGLDFSRFDHIREGL